MFIQKATRRGVQFHPAEDENEGERSEMGRLDHVAE